MDNPTIAELRAADPLGLLAGKRKPGLFAHYFNNKTVRITKTSRPIGGVLHVVASKREARSLAASLDAICWNF